MDVKRKQDRAKALLGRLPDADLVAQLKHFDAATRNGKGDSWQRLMRSWLIDETERRFPEVDGAIDRAVAEADAADEANGTWTEIHYVGVLLAALPTELRGA